MDLSGLVFVARGPQLDTTSTVLDLVVGPNYVMLDLRMDISCWTTLIRDLGLW
jgi:hypothetical protein